MRSINESMGNADSAIENIAGSSESTAQEVNKQADMTSQIQTRLESTNHTAEAAKATTESLKETIENGKKIATELQQQSVLVDQNTNKISDTVSQLVRNVEKVSRREVHRILSAWELQVCEAKLCFMHWKTKGFMYHLVLPVPPIILPSAVF